MKYILKPLDKFWHKPTKVTEYVSQIRIWITPNNAHFVCLHNQTDLIKLISSLVETPRPEMGLPYKADIQNMHCCGNQGWETGLSVTNLRKTQTQEIFEIVTHTFH